MEVRDGDSVGCGGQSGPVSGAAMDRLGESREQPRERMTFQSTFLQCNSQLVCHESSQYCLGCGFSVCVCVRVCVCVGKHGQINIYILHLHVIAPCLHSTLSLLSSFPLFFSLSLIVTIPLSLYIGGMAWRVWASVSVSFWGSVAGRHLAVIATLCCCPSAVETGRTFQQAKCTTGASFQQANIIAHWMKGCVHPTPPPKHIQTHTHTQTESDRWAVIHGKWEPVGVH